MLSDNLYLDNIQEYVHDEDKIVSLIVRRQLCMHIMFALMQSLFQAPSYFISD